MEHIAVWSICSDGPTIMVHKGWKQNLESTSEAKGLLCNGTAGSSKNPTMKKIKTRFAFVNTSSPNETRDSTQLKRSVREHARKHRHGKLQMPKSTVVSAGSSVKRFECPQRQYSSKQIQRIGHSLGIATSLTTFMYPIQMSPQTHELLAIYLNCISRRMLPSFLARKFSQNPLASPDWFQYAAHDETMLTAMLYSASVHQYLFGILESRSDSKCRNAKTQMLFWHVKTLELVSQCVTSTKAGREVHDSALGAISCLAIGEAMIGNQEQWHIHMRGLRQLLLEYSRHSHKIGFGVPSANESISIAMSRVSSTMRIKLCRSDLVRAVDYNITPHFANSMHPENTLRQTSHQHIWSILPQSTLAYLSEQVSCLFLPLRVSHFDSRSSFEQVLILLVYFVQTICPASYIRHPLRDRGEDSHTLDSHTFLSDLHALQYSLLMPHHATLESSSSALLDVQMALDKAFRLSALLYLKSILKQPFTTAAGSKILLSQLREALGALSAASDAVSQSWITAQQFNVSDLQHSINSFYRWMGAVGALVGTGGTGTWFMTFLRSKFGKEDFVDEAPILSRVKAFEERLELLLDLGVVYGTKNLQALWTEVFLCRGETTVITCELESNI